MPGGDRLYRSGTGRRRMASQRDLRQRGRTDHRARRSARRSPRRREGLNRRINRWERPSGARGLHAGGRMAALGAAVQCGCGALGGDDAHAGGDRTCPTRRLSELARRGRFPPDPIACSLAINPTGVVDDGLSAYRDFCLVARGPSTPAPSPFPSHNVRCKSPSGQKARKSWSFAPDRKGKGRRTPLFSGASWQPESRGC